MDGKYLTDLKFPDNVALTTSLVKYMYVQLKKGEQREKGLRSESTQRKNKVYDESSHNEFIEIENEQIESIERLQISGSDSEDTG